METVTLSELAAGAATLQLSSTGAPLNPLTVVDLSSGRPRGPMPTAHLAERRGVVVGVGQRDDELLPWLTAVIDEEDLDRVAAVVGAAPVAAVTLAGLLEVTAGASVTDALLVESLAYSTLLAGSEFLNWRSRTPARVVSPSDEPVLLERAGDVLTISLNRPDRHNAFGRALRDGLLEGLKIADFDPNVSVVLRGNGSSFCSGGDLDEFGSASDAAVAHLVRLRQSAGYAVHRLRDRVRVVVHGACIGAGIEVPAFAARVEAHDDAYFRLPELGMGLVPGAGGTVSLTRRIGRWRTAYLALTDRPIDVATALSWGLVDERAR